MIRQSEYEIGSESHNTDDQGRCCELPLETMFRHDSVGVSTPVCLCSAPESVSGRARECEAPSERNDEGRE
jgi:hypothetical protein